MKASYVVGAIAMLAALPAFADGGDPATEAAPPTTLVPGAVQVNPAPSGLAAAARLAPSASAAVSTNGAVWGWGLGDGGRLGDGAASGPRSLPVLVSPPPEPVRLVYAGQLDTSLAVGASGRLWAAGQLNTTDTASNEYVDTNLSGVVGVAVGYYHAAAFDTDGVLHMWGANNFGQLGDGTMTTSLTPVIADVPLVKSVTTTASSTAAVALDGEVWTWGSSTLGNGGVARAVPAPIVRPAGMGTVKLVDGDYDHVEALTDDGQVWGWKAGNDFPRRVPFPAGTVITKVSSGPFYAVGRSSTGQWWQWNAGGNPFVLSNAAGALDVQAGYGYTLRLMVDGTVRGVGSNMLGQLGSGTLTNAPSPVITLDPTGTMPLPGAAQIAAGGSHSLAIKQYVNVLGETIGTVEDGDCQDGQPVGQAPATVCLNATVRDFAAGNGPIPAGALAHPDFETFSGKKDPGIVGPVAKANTTVVPALLGDDSKPVYASRSAGTDTTTGSAAFNAWYGRADVAGPSRYAASPVFHKHLVLDQEPQGSGPVLYNFRTTGYFPIDGAGWGNQGKGHNYGFTTEIHAKFTFDGTGVFEGDDDVWVYINGRLAVDMGGSHKHYSDKINLGDAGVQQQLGITAGGTYTFDFFHAERHAPSSYFRIKTSLALRDTANPLATESLYVSRHDQNATGQQISVAQLSTRLNTIGRNEGTAFKTALNATDPDPNADNVTVFLHVGAVTIRCTDTNNKKRRVRSGASSCPTGTTSDYAYTGRADGQPEQWFSRQNLSDVVRGYANGLFDGLDGGPRVPHVEVVVVTQLAKNPFNYRCPTDATVTFLSCAGGEFASLIQSLQSTFEPGFKGAVTFRGGFDVEPNPEFCPQPGTAPLSCRTGWDALLNGYHAAATALPLAHPFLMAVSSLVQANFVQDTVFDDVSIADVLRWSSDQAFVAPQLYNSNGTNATDFARYLNTWNDPATAGLPAGRSKLIVAAVTTQWQVCRQVSCGPVDRGPRQAYRDLHDALDAGGRQYLLGRTTSFRNPTPLSAAFATDPGGGVPGDPYRARWNRRETINAAACTNQLPGSDKCS